MALGAGGDAFECRGWPNHHGHRRQGNHFQPKIRDALGQAKPPPADPHQAQPYTAFEPHRKAALGAIGGNQGLAEADATVSRGHFRMEVHLEGSFAQRAQKHPKEK